MKKIDMTHFDKARGLDLIPQFCMGVDLPVKDILTGEADQKLYLARLQKSLEYAEPTDLLGKRIILVYRNDSCNSAYTFGGSTILSIGYPNIVGPDSYQFKYQCQVLGKKINKLHVQCAYTQGSGAVCIPLTRTIFDLEDYQTRVDKIESKDSFVPFKYAIFAVLP
jgi:hypothetical protein